MNLFEKSVSVFGATAMLAFSSAASAVPFTITTAQFSPGAGYGIDPDEGTGTLLDLRFSTSAFSAQNFILSAAYQSFTFNFGTIDLEEPNAHSGIRADEMDGLGIAATVTFTAPTGLAQTITANGTATPGSVSDSQVDYIVDWSPVTVPFGNGGSFLISLTDMSFSGRGGLLQTATVTLLDAGDEVERTSVPEPGTLALLGVGLAALGLSRRRKTH